jgi:ABC-type sugar transport system ATPase subunit
MTAAAAPSLERSPICSVRGIAKSFDGTQALAGVDLDIYPGEVHAIVGVNGAGKSTLMNILAGAVRPDDGEVLLRGAPVNFQSVHDANRKGIAIVFQELSLFPTLSVVANLFSLREIRRFGLVRQREMKRLARPVLAEIGLEVELDQPVGSLSLGKRQEVEIAKALLGNPHLLILDEPTSALNAREVERLMEVIQEVRARGDAVLYVSHRLEEVFAIADVITVVRAGEIVSTTRTADTSINKVVQAMTGGALEAVEEKVRTPPTNGSGEPLRLIDFTIKGEVENVQLTVRPGEIVGLAGLEGSGVLPILEVLFGQRKLDAGKVLLGDGERAPKSVPAAVQAGIAYIPPDRRREGLMMDQSIHANLSHVLAGALRQAGFLLDIGSLRKNATAIAERLEIKAPSLRMPVAALSGGNQQKVVFGKWMQRQPRIILLNDPTRGVDVGAKAELYQAIRQLAEGGTIVLFVSSDLREYRLVCDRAIVLYQGRVAGELDREHMSEHTLLEAINIGRIERSPTEVQV